MESRKRGHLEVFNRIKFHAVKGKGLDLIMEAEIIDGFAEVRKNLKKIALAYYFMEVVGRTTREAEPHPELYSYILKNLRMLKTETKLKRLRVNFVYEVLTALGFWPRGRALPNPDLKLEEVIERQLSSVRVGKRILS